MKEVIFFMKKTLEEKLKIVEERKLLSHVCELHELNMGFL